MPLDIDQIAPVKALISSKAKLPKGPNGLLAGCSLTILGIGQLAQGSKDTNTKNLEAEWRRWAGQAAVSRIQAFPHF